MEREGGPEASERGGDAADMAGTDGDDGDGGEGSDGLFEEDFASAFGGDAGVRSGDSGGFGDGSSKGEKTQRSSSRTFHASTWASRDSTR